MDKKIFSIKLKQLRKLNNFTQFNLAQKLAINIKTYRLYENPISKNLPSYCTLIKLSNIYNTSLAFFLLQKEINLSKNHLVIDVQNLKQVFAQNLKHFRKLNGFSEEQISSLLGVSKRVYQNYTSPKSTNMPSYDSLVILADIYQKSIDEFFHSQSI